MMNIAEVFLDLLFPRRCVGCAAEGTWFCSGCSAETAGTLWFEPVTRDLFGLYVLDNPKIREAVHALKYNGVYGVAHALGTVLAASCTPAEFCAAMGLTGDIVIVPVPLGRKRLAKRGYNQAEALASRVSEWLQVSMDPHMLIRKSGKTLVGEGRNARQHQAMTQFAMATQARVIPGVSYLLIDDVITTGSTLQICRLRLLEAGATSVKGVAFARKLK